MGEPGRLFLEKDANGNETLKFATANKDWCQIPDTFVDGLKVERRQTVDPVLGRAQLRHAGLDAGTAFEILSIDIADVDVGKNIGAELQTDQAEADKRIAQAKAEERRALAVAMEQEYKAEAQNQRAKLIASEAQIPLAMAEAFRSGNLGVMDYQKYRNVEADTSMRQAIAGQTDSGTKAG